MSTLRPRGFVVLVCAAAAGCDGGGTSGSALPPGAVPPASTATPQARVLPGRMVGLASIGAATRAVSGLLTSDGVLRLHVSGPTQRDFDSPGSVQFVGAIELGHNSASGTGVMIGQGCSVPGRFCGKAAPSEITLTVTAADPLRPTGVLLAAVDGGEEVWTLDLGYWGGTASFDGGWPIQTMQGLYELAHDPAAVMTVDAAGRLFFQSAASGCIGNGVIEQRRDGARNLYDVALTVAGCSAEHASSNADYTGIATVEAHAPWDYFGFGFRMWLSTPPDAGAPAALTLWLPPVG